MNVGRISSKLIYRRTKYISRRRGWVAKARKNNLAGVVKTSPLDRV